MPGPTSSLMDRWEGREGADACVEWRVPAVEFHETLGSTNDRARELLEAGALSWSVVISDEQTAGRGRGGRPWHSPPGSGLWMSIVLRPPMSGTLTGLPILAGLAVAGALEGLALRARIGLKWPNDVYLDGGKVCGILAEGVGLGESAGGSRRRRGGVVLGVGLNVHQRASDFPSWLDRPATSLRVAGATDADRGGLARGILAGLQRRLEPWPGRIPGAALEEYARLDLLRGEALEVVPGPERGVGRGGEGGAFTGVGDGIGPDGSLRVLVREGDLFPGRAVEVKSGSVRLLSEA